MVSLYSAAQRDLCAGELTSAKGPRSQPVSISIRKKETYVSSWVRGRVSVWKWDPSFSGSKTVSFENPVAA